MPAMGGRGGGGLMVPRGGMGRRSSCYPGGGIPSVHSTGRRASSRSEAGIGIFPGILGGSKNPKVRKIDFNELNIWQMILISKFSNTSKNKNPFSYNPLLYKKTTIYQDVSH